MYQLFFTPAWFNGVDLVFDAISLIIALFIAGYSWRIYRINQENKFAYFSFAFVLISLAFLAKITIHGLLYYYPLRNTAAAVLVPLVGITAAGQVSYSELFYRIGFFSHMITMLGAWLLIFFISQKKQGRLKKYYEVSQIALFIYLICLISVVSNFKYFVFYLTASVILGMTVLNYYKNYLNTNKNKNALVVVIAFLSILVGNLLFVFVHIYHIFYVLGEIFLLIGFLLLLYTYRKITKK